MGASGGGRMGESLCAEYSTSPGHRRPWTTHCLPALGGAGAWARVSILPWHLAEPWRGDLGGLPEKRMLTRARKEEVGHWVRTGQGPCMLPGARWPPWCGGGPGWEQRVGASLSQPGPKGTESSQPSCHPAGWGSKVVQMQGQGGGPKTAPEGL